MIQGGFHIPHKRRRRQRRRLDNNNFALLVSSASILLLVLVASSSSSSSNAVAAAAAMTTNNNNSNSNAKSRLVYGKDDALFGAIEAQQQPQTFGNVLDAGTGLHSLRWLATLQEENKGMTSFTAITADRTMQRNVQAEADALGIPQDVGKIVMGNWFDSSTSTSTTSSSIEDQLEEESFHVILADYLIGAMDGFSPYQQDLMIPKLCKYLKPGGRLYIVGLEPIPDSVSTTSTRTSDPANIICKVRQIRDACILLAGHRCYREYPVEWIERQITNSTQQHQQLLKWVNTSRFPILYKHQTIVNQINVARSKFPFFPSSSKNNNNLADEMKVVLDDLEQQSWEATKHGQERIRLGFDYVVTAEKKK